MSQIYIELQWNFWTLLIALPNSKIELKHDARMSLIVYSMNIQLSYNKQIRSTKNSTKQCQ